MRKVGMVFLFVGILFLAVSASAMALEVSGGYFLGKGEVEEYDLSEEGNGLTVSGQIPLLGPLGVMGNYTTVTTNEPVILLAGVMDTSPVTLGLGDGPDGKFSHIDFGLTCSLPLAGFKVFGGYAVAKSTVYDGVDEYGYMYKGPVAGVMAEVSPANRLTVTGSFGMGFGTEIGWYENGEYSAAPEGIEASMTTYRLWNR